jgi:protein-tyrosine kinase
MSANVDVLRSSELLGSRAQEPEPVDILDGSSDWSPEDFTREQIRGLVRRVFFSSGGQLITQVVFSAAEPHIDVAGICGRVGQALAQETSAHIAVVGRETRAGENVGEDRLCEGAAIKSWSMQTAANLWHVPGFGQRECGKDSGTGRYWVSCLAELRNEFEYAVIQGPAAGISSEAGLLGQLTDGIILVLGAHSTRKATARKIKETLEGTQSRILGTVLSERRFPVPERIYRRL